MCWCRLLRYHLVLWEIQTKSNKQKDAQIRCDWDTDYKSPHSHISRHSQKALYILWTYPLYRLYLDSHRPYILNIYRQLTWDTPERLSNTTTMFWFAEEWKATLELIEWFCPLSAWALCSVCRRVVLNKKNIRHDLKHSVTCMLHNSGISYHPPIS